LKILSNDHLTVFISNVEDGGSVSRPTTNILSESDDVGSTNREGLVCLLFIVYIAAVVNFQFITFLEICLIQLQSLQSKSTPTYHTSPLDLLRKPHLK
jgi:hypothetical protein